MFNEHEKSADLHELVLEVLSIRKVPSSSALV